MKKTVLIIVILVILLGLVGVYYYFGPWRKEKPAPVEEEKVEEEKAEKAEVKVSKIEVGGVEMGVGVEIDVGAATENPVDIPSTNPLKDVANPFRDSYKNPFE